MTSAPRYFNLRFQSNMTSYLVASSPRRLVASVTLAIGDAVRPRAAALIAEVRISGG